VPVSLLLVLTPSKFTLARSAPRASLQSPFPALHATTSQNMIAVIHNYVSVARYLHR
jgi:hypothetical protein